MSFHLHPRLSQNVQVHVCEVNLTMHCHVSFRAGRHLTHPCGVTVLIRQPSQAIMNQQTYNQSHPVLGTSQSKFV